ncbi:Cof-type HAD-IIB family hydrolase [uncultured Nonlabens sp.]|uniref:Cof-type HAD-IIB family hydrolase n=1 Tax=uncultured Nonlabens sp. TaxID=859306 RepID=UPI002627784C|nr:Cof-type HAD-IIB family hydrolase [uncultured Nonlabens sp.]
MIKLFATDIDGTLLNDKRYLSDRTIASLEKLDMPKILISARMPQAMVYLQEALCIVNSPMICYNGALVLHEEEVLYELSIPFNEIKALSQIAQENGLHVSLYRKEEWFVPSMDKWSEREIHNTRVQPTVQDVSVTLEYLEKTQDKGGAHKIMFMGDRDGIDSAFAKAEQKIGPSVRLYRSKSTYIEITPSGTSKEVALRKLLDFRFSDIGMENVVAFGDNYNDEDMLGAVGYGVAVENARDVVKKAAKYSTVHHAEDGVALWLEQNA